MEQVWSRSELGLVRKMRKIRIKIKDNCCFSYEKKVYRGSGKRTHSMRGRKRAYFHLILFNKTPSVETLRATSLQPHSLIFSKTFGI